MNDESALAPAAGPEVVTETPAELPPEEGQVETQTAEPSEGDEERKSKAAARRERDKAHKERLRAELEEASARAQRAEQELAKIKQRIDAPPPRQEDYDSYERYQGALAAYEVRLADASDKAKDIEADVQSSRAQAQALTAEQRRMVQEHYRASVEEASTRYADYEAVVGRRGLFPEGHPLPDLIQMSDAPADLAYAVAKDQGLHDALLRMHPLDMARELGRLEASITAARPKPATTAPPPISPVKGMTSPGKDPTKMNYAEFKAFREAGGKL